MKQKLRSRALFSALIIAAFACGIAEGATSIMNLNGTCQKLIVGKYDWTRWCKNNVGNTEDQHGNVVFVFMVEGNGLSGTLKFFGYGPAQIKLSADSITQPINRIAFSIEDMPTTPDKAVGSCHFTNPYKGAALIECSAQTSGSSYHAIFRSDGKSPEDF